MNKVYAVGLGPGGEEFFTGQAKAAIEKSDVICGYTVYVDLVRDLFPDKEIFTTNMKQEIDRCRKALEIAESGKTVAMVCSGDSGVYGMAGLLIQLAPEYKDIEVEASSENDAREEVERMIGDGEIHFDDEQWLNMEVDAVLT